MQGKEVNVQYWNHQLRLCLDMGIGIGGDKWPAADVLCSLLTCPKWITIFANLLKGKSVLELGSGNGVVGILVDKAFSIERVVITDLQSHIQHIDHNIKLNDCKNSISVPYDWNSALHFDNSVKADKSDNILLCSSISFDIIFALECVYKEDLYEPLILSIKKFSHSKTICFIGCTRQFTKPLFFTLLNKYGFVYKKLPNQNIPHSIADESIGLFVIYQDAV